MLSNEIIQLLAESSYFSSVGCKKYSFDIFRQYNIYLIKQINELFNDEELKKE